MANRYLYISLLFYAIPIIIFGHWNIFNTAYFPISLLLLKYLIQKGAIDKGSSGWETYAYSILNGFSISMYGISIIGMTMEGSIISISVYLGILVYCLSSFPFIFFAAKYRDKVSSDYKKLFGSDSKSFERDRKIDKLLNI